MSLGEYGQAAAIVFAPAAIVLIVALWKGYNIHVTKYRVTEHKKDKDKKDKDEKNA